MKTKLFDGSVCHSITEEINDFFAKNKKYRYIDMKFAVDEGRPYALLIYAELTEEE